MGIFNPTIATQRTQLWGLPNHSALPRLGVTRPLAMKIEPSGVHTVCKAVTVAIFDTTIFTAPTHESMLRHPRPRVSAIRVDTPSRREQKVYKGRGTPCGCRKFITTISPYEHRGEKVCDKYRNDIASRYFSHLGVAAMVGRIPHIPHTYHTRTTRIQRPYRTHIALISHLYRTHIAPISQLAISQPYRSDVKAYRTPTTRTPHAYYRTHITPTPQPFRKNIAKISQLAILQLAISQPYRNHIATMSTHVPHPFRTQTAPRS